MMFRFFRREGVVLVCTDAAARGLDIPGVTHVVQAEFAPSAVDFIHRVTPFPDPLNPIASPAAETLLTPELLHS